PKPDSSQAKPAAAPTDIPISLLGTTYSLAERSAFHHVPGVSVAVIKNFKTAWVGHYGEASAGKPVTDATRYMAGSMGQPLVAAAVLKASESDTVSLDAPMDSLLTSWKVPASPLINPSRPITVRDLLTQQSGFTYNKYDGYAPGEPIPSTTAILKGESPAKNPATTVQFAPGSHYDMAAENYTVIEQVITDVARQPFGETMRDSLLSPLGMKNSTFSLPPKTDWAMGHSESGEPIEGGAWAYPESAASGLWTTPRDFAGAIAELLRCGANRGGTYLKPETAALLSKPLPLSGTESPQAIGFGLTKREGVTYLYRGGNTNGFYCHLDADAEAGNAVIVFTNGNLCWRFANEVRDAVARSEGFRGF
ncbi:MAG: beta-lactamase family protein, partial [Armatimonadetes bacterium]|nr:beta-lactamase family protein [Armatimonadota bacterium]